MYIHITYICNAAEVNNNVHAGGFCFKLKEERIFYKKFVFVSGAEHHPIFRPTFTF